jgi:Flp pilus assembly protein TadG
MTRNAQRGVAIIEFALVLPLLLLLVFLATEFGRAMLYYDRLAASVRGAARYGSIQVPDTKQDEARNLVVYGNTEGAGSPLVPGLATDQVDVSWQSAGTFPEITTVRVQVTGFTFTPLVAGAFGVAIDPITFSDIVATMRSQP